MNSLFASLAKVPLQLCLPFPINRAYHCTSAGIDLLIVLLATKGRTNARKNLLQILRSMLNRCAVVYLNSVTTFCFIVRKAVRTVRGVRWCLVFVDNVPFRFCNRSMYGVFSPIASYWSQPIAKVNMQNIKDSIAFITHTIKSVCPTLHISSCCFCGLPQPENLRGFNPYVHLYKRAESIIATHIVHRHV